MRPKPYPKHASRHVSRYPAQGAQGKVFIYGKHSLVEALRNTPRVIRKVYLAPEIRDTELRALLEKNAVLTAPLVLERGNDFVGKGTAHQGVIAVMSSSALLVSLDDFLQTLDMGANPSIAILGEVQDPHNVGAIIRSAAAFGISGVLIPEHNQAPITGAVVKASSGMVFRVPLVSIGNVNHALRVLKERGFWIYGLAKEGKTTLGTETFNAPSVFIVGNESTGVREKTLAACDVTLSIPIHSRTESLNAAVSAAIVFYEWSRKHPEAL